AQQDQLEAVERLISHGARCPPRWWGLRRLETYIGGAEAQDVAVAAALLATDAGAVDHRAVRRPEVGDDVAAAPRADLGVATADVLVVEGEVAVALAADHHRPVAQREP